MLWSITVFMSGCVPADGAKNIPIDIGKYGVYVKLERDDVSSVLLQGGGFSKAYKNADGSLLKAWKWLYMGGDIARLSNDGNCSVLFTVEARNEENAVLENDAVMTWLAAQGEDLVGYLKKLQLIDEVYQKLLETREREEEIAWGSEEAELPVGAVETVMRSAGRR